MTDVRLTDTNLRSDEMNDLISGKPGFIEGLAPFIYLFILFIVLLLAWVIRYPENIYIKTKIYVKFPPVQMVAKKKSTVRKYLVKDYSYVKLNQPVVILNGNEGHQDSSEITWQWEANATGYIHFTFPELPNYNFDSGEVIGSIHSPEEKYTAKILIPGNLMTVIKSGEVIEMKLDNYPEKEFGTIAGKLKKVSQRMADGNYFGVLEFPFGLKTNLNREIPYEGGLDISTKIKVRDIRLIDFFIRSFKKEQTFK